MEKQPIVLNKTLVIGIIFLLIITVSPIVVSDVMLYPISSSNIILLERDDCPINITVHEAWDLLTDTGNGIQIPIDIRSEEQWNESFIDTPWPEYPRWFGDIENNMENFMEEFDGEEVVIYCTSGYRSLLACYVLCGADFNGTVYNMIGGITTWIDEGYPIRNNTPPYAPSIIGEHPRARQSTKGFTKNYTFTTIDPDGDKIYLYIDWDDGTFEKWVGPYDSGEEITITHIYDNQGTPGVKAKAKDIFDAEGPIGTEMIPILRSKQMINSWFQLFLDRFPLLEKLLFLFRVM